MGRYDLNLRPRYDEADYAQDQALPHAIGGAITAYMTKQDAEREERNKISAEGGYQVGEPPASPMDRIRHAGSAIKGGFDRVFRPGVYQEGRREQADQIPTGRQAIPPIEMTPRRAGPGTPMDETTRRGSSGWDEHLPAGVGGGGSQGDLFGGGSVIRGATQEGPSIGNSLSELTGLPPTYDIEASGGQHYRIPRGTNPTLLAEIIRNQGEDVRSQRTRSSAERIAGMQAGARVSAAQISAGARARAAATPRAESPSLTRSRSATAAHAEAETAALGNKQTQAQADQLVQALQSQNPGRKVTGADVAQYAAGLKRNGRLRASISDEELYAAVDRYHNPPNQAPRQATVSSIMAEQMQQELGSQGRAGRGRGVGPSNPAPAGGGRTDRPGPPSMDRGGDSAGGKATIDQAAYDRAIAKGYSDARIRALYNVPSTIRRKAP